jgi:predicted N-acetyltransferase YhbS
VGAFVTLPKLTKPSLIGPAHELSGFDCGEPELNEWLGKHAKAAVAERTANVVVVCRGPRVVGYYALANGAVAHPEVSAKVRRNTPNPIPAIILARLAVDISEQGAQLGKSLLRDAFKRSLLAARHSAARLLLVQPLHDKAAAFYAKHGFKPLRNVVPPSDPPQPMYLLLQSIQAAL